MNGLILTLLNILILLVILAVSFIRVLVTNSIIYTVALRKTVKKKRLVLRASLFSELAISIALVLFTIVLTILLWAPSYSGNIFDKISRGFFIGLVSNIFVSSGGNFIEAIIPVIEFIVALILIYCFNRFVVYKN